MKANRRFTILGCGSSPGVPRITGDWGACDPNNLKNRRRRASLLIEQRTDNGDATTIVVDTGPDFRDQMINAGVQRIDGVVYTHQHADHLHGIDDLRGYVFAQRHRVRIYANPSTMARLREGFDYCFETPPGSQYPPIVKPNLIQSIDEPVVIEGPGGSVSMQPIEQIHGGITSLGFRIGDVAYCCDVSGFSDEAAERLQNLDVLIIDALQYKPHPSHLSLSETLEWIERLKPRRAILTHMHIPLDYDTVLAETPDHVEPGYDMMLFEQIVDVA